MVITSFLSNSISVTSAGMYSFFVLFIFSPPFRLVVKYVPIKNLKLSAIYTVNIIIM